MNDMNLGSISHKGTKAQRGDLGASAKGASTAGKASERRFWGESPCRPPSEEFSPRKRLTPRHEGTKFCLASRCPGRKRRVFTEESTGEEVHTKARRHGALLRESLSGEKA